MLLLLHAHKHETFSQTKGTKSISFLHRHNTKTPSHLDMKPNLLNRKRRKGLCKLSTKSQSETHLHLPDCQPAFNFSESPCLVSH